VIEGTVETPPEDDQFLKLARDTQKLPYGSRFREVEEALLSYNELPSHGKYKLSPRVIVQTLSERGLVPSNIDAVFLRLQETRNAADVGAGTAKATRIS
jgi:hypothetical protein